MILQTKMSNKRFIIQHFLSQNADFASFFYQMNGQEDYRPCKVFFLEPQMLRYLQSFHMLFVLHETWLDTKMWVVNIAHFQRDLCNVFFFTVSPFRVVSPSLVVSGNGISSPSRDVNLVFNRSREHIPRKKLSNI